MKPQDTLARLKRFHVDEKRRRVQQIESMVAEFSRIAQELDREVALEEQRAGIFDLTHFAYPTYARAARTRRDNLVRSADELRAQLDEAQRTLEEAVSDLGKVQGYDPREREPDAEAEATSNPLDEAFRRLRAARA
jgi:flagellar FliJ protein